MGNAGDKDGAPPAPLVLGARLHCLHGGQDTFLTVETNYININYLPQASVEDSKAFVNIQPFGKCDVIDVCEYMMVLEDKWVNAAPQNSRTNGKEIITTESTLICTAKGVEIQALTSGQDGIFASQLLFKYEMDAKYPGLRAILEDPHQSLYLNEGKYEMAIRFIEEGINKHGGTIPITTLYGANKGMEEAYILAALERLLPGCNTREPHLFIEDIIDVGTMNMIVIEEGRNQDYLNAVMMDLIMKDCQKTAERIKNDPGARAKEENKVFWDNLEVAVNNAQYMAVGYSSTAAQNMKARPKVDKNLEYERTGREVLDKNGNVIPPEPPKWGGGTPNSSGHQNWDSKIPRTGKDWYEYFQQKYGSENVSWDSAEKFYRAMTKSDYEILMKTGHLPYSDETFISTQQSYSAGYKGVLVEFTAENGTLEKLRGIGAIQPRSRILRDMFPELPTLDTVTNWRNNNAYFKFENDTLNIGLGRGKALDIFNESIRFIEGK